MAQLCSDLDDEIGRFFSQVSTTRAECDDLARTMFGGLVDPVSVQGATSYTVVVGLNREKIVQFRYMDARLDMRMLDLARRVHGDVVPADSREITTPCLARFFAQAWRRPVVLDRCALSAVAAEFSSRLDEVSCSGVLTARFRLALDEVKEHLPTLVSGDFLLALTHSDLNELNILVDGGTGTITGVIDWTDAGI
ncbi:hypothetical protein NKR23_g2129 [Pleurostoma richardsiae]|uniref:Aminoglycoside phosphotransferase domain-containing protein n=1 Tax=Pleurostoma richardsiae TaxID=41990 RepID=A0AA38VNM7_9PEZI|nr:hypothetical protein NKR23_g2129 [Pleurostoma richardsiae]